MMSDSQPKKMRGPMIGPAPTMRELVSVPAHRGHLPFALLHDTPYIADPDAESENGRQSDSICS
jgi:hypothetical protein